jgi:hypothetical protein
MEGIKTIQLKDDRLCIEGERDTVDLVIAGVLNLVEKPLEKARRRAQKNLQKSFGKVDKEEFFPEKAGSDHYAIKKVGRDIEKGKESRRNI